MTTKKNYETEQLVRLADTHAEDVIDMPDADVLEEAREAFGDIESLVNETRTLFARAQAITRKDKLEAARRAVAEQRSETATRIIRLDKSQSRKQYEKLFRADSENSKKITLAARNGQGQSENDINSTIEDLAELGALDDENNK